MRSLLLLITAVIFIFAACNTNGNQESKETAHAEDIHLSHDGEADADDSLVEIELENGERWVVNEEMKPFVVASETLVSSYIDMASEDHAQLAADLRTQNDALIKSCTMTGKSHEELHKWLHPHIGLVKNLREASAKPEADALVVKLNESFEIYHRYFQ